MKPKKMLSIVLEDDQYKSIKLLSAVHSKSLNQTINDLIAFGLDTLTTEDDQSGLELKARLKRARVKND